MVSSCMIARGVVTSSPDAEVLPSEKTKYKQQATMLDAWCALHDDNLYPCREVKERLAKEMSMTYVQVNRWFANRRRKQIKRHKPKSDLVRSVALSSANAENSANFNDVESNNWPKASSTDLIEERRKDTYEMGINSLKSHSHEVYGIDAGNESHRETPLSYTSSNSLQQASDMSRLTLSPTPGEDDLLENKLLLPASAYTPSALSAAFSNVSAAAMAVMATQTVNPLLLAAMIGLQQQHQQQGVGANQAAGVTGFPWAATNPSQLLPYLHAQQMLLAQQAVLSQNFANLQHFGTAAEPSHDITSIPSHSMHWQPSPLDHLAQPIISNTVLSPLHSSADDSTSELSDISEISSPPQDCSIATQDIEARTEFDSLINLLLERHKDLSEMESMAVAVLAGMADCSR